MNMLTSAYTATDSAQESDGYHYGSVSSAASSNFSNFGNVEQNSSMANVYGGDVARFYPSGTFCQAADVGPHASPSPSPLCRFI